MNNRSKIFGKAEFDIDRLVSLAERLHGRPCHCDRDQFARSSTRNWVIALQFDDGTEWIFRSPHLCAISEELGPQVIESEVATTRFIAAGTTVPVPTVHAYRYVES